MWTIIRIIICCYIFSYMPFTVDSQCLSTSVPAVTSVQYSISVTIQCYNPGCNANYNCALGYSGAPYCTCNSILGIYQWTSIIGSCTRMPTHTL